jgi:hypothetical protein
MKDATDINKIQFETEWLMVGLQADILQSVFKQE